MIFSILVFVTLVLSICIKDRKKSLGVQALSCFFEAVYDFIIGAFTGAFLSIMNFIRTFIFMQSEKISKKIGSIIRTYCLWQTNMKLVRISGITTGVFYGLYYSYYHSWFLVMGDIILLLTSMMSIYKNDVQIRINGERRL